MEVKISAWKDGIWPHDDLTIKDRGHTGDITLCLGSDEWEVYVYELYAALQPFLFEKKRQEKQFARMHRQKGEQ